MAVMGIKGVTLGACGWSRREFVLGFGATLAANGKRGAAGAGQIVPLPPSAELPQALRFASGRVVKTRAEWAARRRQILESARQQMYGVAPGAAGVRFEVIEAEGEAFGGLAKRRQVRVHFKAGAPTALMLLYSPKRVDRAPVIVGLNFWGNHTVSDDPGIEITDAWVESGKNPFADLACVVDHRATEACGGIDARRWPVEEMLRRGYALCTMYRGDIDADLADESVPRLRAAYPELEAREDNFGAIGAWAWALSRMLDYLQTDRDVDARRAVVFGWSRLGKAAVWAGAQDARFAAVLSQESGAGGAKLFRRGVGEDIHRLNTVFPHWFAKSFRAYNGMDKQLPFDQHLILSAIAPRPLMISSAVEDHGSDPAGEFASGVLASEVYRFLGVDGLPNETMPDVGKPLFGRVSYQIRAGGHDVTEYDWEQYFTFLDRYIRVQRQ
jgi:hypothetical protein